MNGALVALCVLAFVCACIMASPILVMLFGVAQAVLTNF